VPRPAARYRPHPLLETERGVRAKIEAETGRSFDAWLRIARRAGASDPKGLKRRLQEEHGLKPMQAGWLAWAATTDEPLEYDEPEPLVDALYSGTKAGLRPLHEAVVDACLALGDDVVVTACKTMVPVYRKHVFAQLKPTKDGVVVGLALGDGVAAEACDFIGWNNYID